MEAKSRNENGTFVQGHSGGPGRKKKVSVDYRAIFEHAVTEVAMFRIIERALADAINGDARARAWLVSYLVAPIPKTMKIEDATTLSRSKMDAGVSQLPPEEFAVLEAILSKVEGANNG